MVTFKIVLDERRCKSNGEFPIVIRVYRQRKSTSVLVGISIKKSDWDEKLCQVNTSNSYHGRLNKAIVQKLILVKDASTRLESQDKFSFEALREALNPKKQLVEIKPAITFQSFTEDLIKQMMGTKQVGNAIVYQTALNRLILYSSTDLTFKDIDYNFLQGFKNHLIKDNIKVNSISNYFRTIRAIYNKAIKSKVVDKALYPFDDVSIKTEKTAKRAISIADLKVFVGLKFSPSSPLWLAQQYFMLSFSLIGISFTDLAYLTDKSIVKGRLVFRRRKTGKLYNIKLHKATQELVDALRGICSSKYIFPILRDGIEEDSLQAKKQILQWIKTTNKYLGKISDQMSLDKPLTTYVARHTWATTAKRLGYSNDLIAEAMGHEHGNRTTAIYLDDFDQEVIDGMSEVICKHIIISNNVSRQNL